MGLLKFVFLITLLPASAFALDKLEQVTNDSCEIGVPVVLGQELYDEITPYLRERGFFPYPVSDASEVQSGYQFDFTMRTETGIIMNSLVTLVHLRNKIDGKTFTLAVGRSTDNIKNAIKELPTCRLAK
jgi:hypothetical protein